MTGAKKNHKAGPGRGHKIKLDAGQVRELAGIGCTTDEMARIFRCSTDTLERNYMDAMEEGRANLKMSLRRKQVKLALEDGDKGMLIWLGKQYLGQRDKHEHTGSEGGPIQYADAREKLLKQLTKA